MAGKKSGLKDQALVDAVSKQPWDPSIKAMAALADVVKRLATDIQWTTDLGNAFLAQESDVMNAVQRMRAKAQNKGTLQSDEHQRVETKVENNKSVIVVEQAQPDVVYVPSQSRGGLWCAGLSISVDLLPSLLRDRSRNRSECNFVWHGHSARRYVEWRMGLGRRVGFGDVDINRNNNFNNNLNFNRTNAGNRTGRNTWQHNPAHRGGTPYANRATANRFGSNARGDSLAGGRQGAQQQIAAQKGNLGSVANRGAAGGAAARSFSSGGATAAVPGAPRPVVPEAPRPVVPEAPRPVVPEAPRPVVPEAPWPVVPAAPIVSAIGPWAVVPVEVLSEAAEEAQPRQCDVEP